jgi:hypothetical protein
MFFNGRFVVVGPDGLRMSSLEAKVTLDSVSGPATSFSRPVRARASHRRTVRRGSLGRSQYLARFCTPTPPGSKVFRHAASGALIVLPQGANGASVSRTHLAAVQQTLENYEIADSLELASRLQPDMKDGADEAEPDR